MERTMQKINVILMMLFIVSCAVKEEPLKTFTAEQVTDSNVFSFVSVTVKVNPNLNYSDISGSIKKRKKWQDPTKREFHMFASPMENKIVLIETHTRTQPDSFQSSRGELTKNKEVIQRGSKLIAGETWELYTRSLPEFDEYILNAFSQKKIRMEQYRCGLEIGIAREIDRFNRIYVRYIKGMEQCQSLPQNGSILNDEQLRLMRVFAGELEETITVSG